MRYSILGLLGLSLNVSMLYAETLKLGSDNRWLVLASRQSIDEAIGIASHYRYMFDSIRVVKSTNGWLAVVAGPIKKSLIEETKKKIQSSPAIAKDTFFSAGASFVSTVWTPKAEPPRTTWESSKEKPLALNVGNLRISVNSMPVSNDSFAPEITATENNATAFQYRMTDSSTTNGNAQLRAINLDPKNNVDEIVFSSFWGGAHCCTVTRFFTKTDHGWTGVNGTPQDGDGGYQFEDVDNDGVSEIVSSDGSFLYAFAPYAMSWAPLKIEQLRDNKLVDLRKDPRFQTYYRRELYQTEYSASLEPEIWTSNGFLAAWAALKYVLHEGDDVWPKIITNYDRADTWPLTICDRNRPDGACEKGYERPVAFPEALRFHLEKTGYIPYVSPPPTNSAVSEAPQNPPRVLPKPLRSMGTAFYVSGAGHLVTNQHVVEECQEVAIRQIGSAPETVSVIATDKGNDLAILKTNRATLKSLPLRTSVRLGEFVAAFGYPLSSVLSSGGNFTTSNITAVAGLSDDSRYFQTSAPVQPGNSGGPLVDESGNVVGVVTGKLNAVATAAITGDVPQNVNFALKASMLATFLETYSVSFTNKAETTILRLPDVAQRASEASVAVLCR